jgi:hypothetical protein
MKIFPNLEENRIQVLDERFYKSETNELLYYPGATTILEIINKVALNVWYKQVGMNAEYILKEAGEKGSRIHRAIEQFNRGETISVMDDEGNMKIFKNFEEWKMICKFHRWYEIYQPEILGIEQVLVSDTLRFGGTLDLICKIPNEKDPEKIDTWYIDYKTGNNIYYEAGDQAAAYIKLCEEKGLKIDRAGILHLNSDHRTEKFMQGIGWYVKEITDKIDEHWQDFLSAQDLWMRRNPNYQPKNLTYPMELSIEETKRLIELKQKQ